LNTKFTEFTKDSKAALTAPGEAGPAKGQRVSSDPFRIVGFSFVRFVNFVLIAL
jgi:hypothetical protein